VIMRVVLVRRRRGS